MRRIALALTLALTSLAFAPAPLPKRGRETAFQKRERELAECAGLLRELGVKWSVAAVPGGPVVRYAVEVSQPGRSGSLHGEYGVVGDDLPGALRHVIRRAGAFVRKDGPY
jgi:hypothetical protein